MKEKIRVAQSVMLRLADDLVMLEAVREESSTAVVRAQLEICKSRIFDTLGALADLQHGVTNKLDELRESGEQQELDVVPVVRCKDCASGIRDGAARYCKWTADYVPEEGFCFHGRREEG